MDVDEMVCLLTLAAVLPYIVTAVVEFVCRIRSHQPDAHA